MVNRKKYLSVILLIIVFVFIIPFAFKELRKKEIRKDVLSRLEERLEFCEIIKEEIGKDSGKFWLMCNLRPLYTEYVDGEIKLDLNGWSFIREDKDLYSELLDCDFYDTRENDLVFYCPKDFNSARLIAKIYNFNQESFTLEKKEEKDFLDILSGDIKKSYPLLSSCETEGFKPIATIDYPAIVSVYFNCEDDQDYVVYTDLSTVPIQPPILIRETEIPDKEKAEKSFNKSFDLAIDNVDSADDFIFINSGNLQGTYIFGNIIPIFSYYIDNINSDDVEKAVENFGKYFIFPLDGEINEIEKMITLEHNIIFKINSKDIISVAYNEEESMITGFFRKTNAFYR